MSKYIPGNQKHLTLEGHIYIETSLNKGLAFKDIVRSLGGNDFATPLPARKRTDFNPRSHEGNDSKYIQILNENNNMFCSILHFLWI